MAVIKDLYCIICETVTPNEWVDGCDWTEGARYCQSCGYRTIHNVVCNGGRRPPNIDGRDWSGDFEHLGAVAEFEDGTPATVGGTPINELPKFSKDACDDRRERRRYEFRKRQGKDVRKIFVDQKSA